MEKITCNQQIFQIPTILVAIYFSAVCSANHVDHHESRKPGRQSNNANNTPSLNSLNSSQDAPTKTQSNQQPAPYGIRQPQQTSTPAYTSSSSQAQSSIYTHLASNSQPPNTLPQGGYLVSVNAHGGSTAG